MKILIDTNIYLDFYRSNKQALKLFDEMTNHLDKIILTDQIEFEFERNREPIIKKLLADFKNKSKIDEFTTSYLLGLSEFSDFKDAQKNYAVHSKRVEGKIVDILKDRSKDPVARFFDDFVREADTKGMKLQTTKGIIKRAQKRKLVGNPPSSDKYSIGDEINWEIILENVKEDIVIVGRDNTYNLNISFLQKDYHLHTGYQIIKLTDKITEALSIVGITTTEELIDAEESFIKDIKEEYLSE